MGLLQLNPSPGNETSRALVVERPGKRLSLKAASPTESEAIFPAEVLANTPDHVVAVHQRRYTEERAYVLKGPWAEEKPELNGDPAYVATEDLLNQEAALTHLAKPINSWHQTARACAAYARNNQNNEAISAPTRLNRKA